MSLSSYWVSQNRKDLAEQAIVAKRERDAARFKQCYEVHSYHKDIALKTSKYKSWEDGQFPKCINPNEESSVKERKRFAEKEKLHSRRQRLAHLLSIENEQFMKELRAMQDNEREKDPWNICRLKEQIADLQKKRRETEQNMQKRYTHHLFGSSIAHSSEKEAAKLQQEVSEAWQMRRGELEKLSLEREEREKERSKNLELEQMKVLREASEVEMEQLDEQEKWSKIIQDKIKEISSADTEIKKVKAENQILNQQLEVLSSQQNKRNTVCDLQRKSFQKMQTLWQPKEKLRKMLSEVQHSLDMDYKLVLDVISLSRAGGDTALPLINLDCVEEAKAQIETQIDREKERHMEIQQLYNEEATKQLQKRLSQWNSESSSRDETMNNLFKTVEKEMKEKMEMNMKQERKLMHLKDTLSQEINETNTSSKESIKSLEEKKQFYLDRAKTLGEELQMLNEASSSRPSTSSGQSVRSIFSR